MSFLNVYNLAMEFGAEPLFGGAEFEIGENDKIALIGANGVGKTTLFKLICGSLKPSEGQIFKSKNAEIGYMEQHACAGSDKTVYEEMLTVFAPLISAEEELEDISRRIEAGDCSDELLERQSMLQIKFENDGGLTYKSRARSTLIGLGFTPQDLELTCNMISGGQRSKISLGKLLLSGANFLLLDEPTNHLDIRSVEWLEDFLKDFSGSYIVISHDRYFLDRVTNKTMLIEHGKLTLGGGSYSQFFERLEKEKEIEEKHYQNTMREARRIEAIIAQQRQWNREKNIKTAESKQKQLDRLLEGVERPEAQVKTLNFDFTVKNVSGNDVIYADSLSKSFDGKKLFENVSFLLKRKEKVFILGENGSGKTTLFKIIMETLASDNGSVRLGAGVKIGYFDQNLENLKSGGTVLSEIHDAYPFMSDTQVRNALAAFLFCGDDVNKKISQLSGGEKARLSILKIMLSGANLLLLDEPTNNLDISSREALENALKAYDGTILAISHDRYFIDKLADRILWLSETGTEEFIGNYSLFMEEKMNSQEQTTVKPEKKKVNSYLLKKERASERRKLLTAIGKCEEKIAEQESESERLTACLESTDTQADYQELIRLTEEFQSVNSQIEELYSEWEELSSKLTEFDNEA